MTETQAHEAQAAVEGVTIEPVVTLKGKDFRIGGRPTAWALMELHHALGAGKDILGPLYRALAGLIHEDDFEAFGEHAHDQAATSGELVDVVNHGLGIAAARPTVPPASSSAGPPPTSESLTGGSSSPEAPASPVSQPASSATSPTPPSPEASPPSSGSSSTPS